MIQIKQQSENGSSVQDVNTLSKVGVNEMQRQTEKSFKLRRTVVGDT